MWNPKKSNPSLMCTIWVLAADSRSPSGASTTATSSRRASTSARVPCTSTTKSSADDAPVRQVLASASGATAGGGHGPACLPRPMQVLIEHRQGNVGQQRGQDATLWRAGMRLSILAEFGENPCFEERLDQQQHPLVLSLI